MKESWRPKPGDRVIRHPREDQIRPRRDTVTGRRVQSRALASPLLLVYSFVGLISVGTLLLILPFTHHGGGFTPLVDALFTATSASTVTGLITVDTSTYWTRTGQVFILALIFVGGLSFMTMATFLLILIGQRLSLTQRILVKDSLQSDHLGGLVSLTVKIVLVATGIQIVGFVALLIRFSLLPDYSIAEAIWQAAFHAVSGFNGAGFTIVSGSESLSGFKIDKVVLGIMGVLIFLGALSYWIMVDVVRSRRFSLLTMNSKLVLILTLVLTLSGSAVFFFSEYDNANTLGPVSFPDKVVVSVFESISGRTAGFSTVSYGDTAQHTNLFFTSLMFIGGASASVAGGIKINTVAVILVVVLSTIRGKSHASAFGREISRAQIHKAMSIGVVAIAFVFLIGLMLTFAESTPKGQFAFIDLLFESVSAFGTVGLSTGLTSELSRWGHIILIITMFLGRIGPLILTLAIIRSAKGDLYRYPQERITIG